VIVSNLLGYLTQYFAHCFDFKVPKSFTEHRLELLSLKEALEFSN